MRDYRKLKEGASETVRSIVIMVNAQLRLFEIPEIKRIFEGTDDIDIPSLGLGVEGNPKKKTALFLVMPSGDSSYNLFINMFYTQLFTVLKRIADNRRDGQLPIHVRLWADEYYAGPKPLNCETLLGEIRSRNMSIVPILQDIAQIKTLYPNDKWEIFTGNCATTVFLGSGATAHTTHQWVSDMLEDMTIDSRSESLGHSQGSGNLQMSKAGMKLMTPGQISRMPKNDCILFLKGERPIYDKKNWPFNTEVFKEAEKIAGQNGYKNPVYVSYDERNKKYTYNVTINNVEDIVTEVTEEGNPENTPGAEGDIVDSQTTVYNLDAHYGYLILKFKYSEVKDGLQFYVKTPFGETNNDDKSVVGHDCKWLRFARCNNESTLANYPKDGKGLINLFELKADIEDQYQKDTNKDNTYYYTVFVDEYFYENNPLETSSNNNWGNENWEEFVNKDDRYALLIFSPQKSPDGESSYASAKYMITQKSIQTYYSTEKFNSDKTALGMEHIDETGVPNGWESGSYGSSQENGYKNTYPVVNNTNISSYGTETLSNGKNTFTINDAANAIQACMARNRDENNDGKISGSEVKWFLPAINQLVGMFLGAESLPTPLFGDGDKQPGTYTYNKKEIGTYGTYHYISSDKQRLWSEEGATFGPAAGILYAKAPEKLRCVRTLGISSQYNSTSKKEGKIYNMNNSYTFQMAYLDKQSIRTSFIENGELDLHHNFSSYNRPYTAFQVANKRMTIDGIETSNGWGGSNNRPRPTNWESLVKNSGLSRSVCTNYFENANKSDKGSWRAPNQRELMIIYLQDPSLVEYQVTDAYDYRYGSFTMLEIQRK